MDRRFAAAAAATAVGALLVLAGPVSLAATAHAADEVPYADQVAVGPAVKLANPDLTDLADVPPARAATQTPTPSASVAAAATRTSRPEPVDESTVTATPSNAVVIETHSHQADSPLEGEVAVLGTKFGSAGTEPGRLADTGPGTLTLQATLAVALLAVGALLRGGPQLAGAVRRGAARRH